jgi:hypothetical protein
MLNVFYNKRLHHKKWTRYNITQKELKERIKQLNSKTYLFLNHKNEEIIIVNMRNFCRENNLNSNFMFRVANGKIKQYRGFHLKGTDISKLKFRKLCRKHNITFVLKNIDGRVAEVTNLSKFCRDNRDLNINQLSRLTRNIIQNYKGWVNTTP